MSLLIGQTCVACEGDAAATSITLSASVASSPGPDCSGDPHLTHSAQEPICLRGTWNGTLSITSGHDCCDTVSVVLVDVDGNTTTLASLGSSESSVNFTFTLGCEVCGDGNKVQVIASDVDGCSNGWTGGVELTFGDPLP